MKRPALLFIFFIGFLNAFNAQSELQKKADNFKDLYNAKSYDVIYSQLNGDFKKTLREADFTKFLSNDIYLNFGLLQKNEFNFRDNKNSFICYFEKGKLIVNMRLDKDGAISFLEFLPYFDAPKNKRADYISDNKRMTALDSTVDRLVSAYMQSPENCGMSIGIFSKNESHFYNYGTMKREETAITTQQTIYEIGSLSKVFCGILLAQAILEKKVNADDDVRKFLPLGNYSNLEINGTPVRLIHLANHSSGLPRIPDDIELQQNYNPLDPYHNYNREMVFNFLKKVELNSQPGTLHDYSNIGMALLGIILEKVYNKSFEELVAEKIASPLQLNKTYITKNTGQSAYLAGAYNSEGNVTPYWNMNDMAAAGGIKSSTFDLLKLLTATMSEVNSNIPGPLSLAAKPTFTNGNTIGMGWHIIKTKQGNTLTWHNGGTFGFSGFMGFVKEKNCAVVILSNSGNMVDFIALGILKHLQK